MSVILNRARLPEVVFDVNNKEHLKAGKGIVLEGRQHPTIRFALEDQYRSVDLMILKKIAQKFLGEKLENPNNSVLPAV